MQTVTIYLNTDPPIPIEVRMDAESVASLRADWQRQLVQGDNAEHGTYDATTMKGGKTVVMLRFADVLAIA